MRTVFEEEEEDLAPAHEQPDRELTLSSTTLLVIFFGLVLVCGLFFGLGYTLGRRSSPTEVSQEAVKTPANVGTSAPVSTLPKPSAASASPTVAADPAPAPSTSDTQSADAPAEAPAQSAASTLPTPTVKPALQELKPIAKTPVPAANVQPAKLSTELAAAHEPAAAPSGIMVQIAAVSNPADANVLIGALQKHGYTVAARRQSTDTLIHVQVGPFPTRADAIAMRQKLLGDGYNAILK